MPMTATLQVPSNVIAGRPATFMLTLSNTGASDVDVTTIQPVVTAGGPGAATSEPTVVDQPPVFPIGRTKTVAASGSLSVPMRLVFQRPATPSLGAVMPGSTFLVDAIIQVSDGTQFSCTTPQWVAVSSGAPAPGPADGSAQFAFNDGTKLVYITLL